MSFCYLYIITVILCVIYCTIATYYMHCKICKVHTFFAKNKFCVTKIVFKTFVVNRIYFMHYIYFIFMLYTLFVNATVCKHYKVKILKMNANRTNRSKVINRAIQILFSCKQITSFFWATSQLKTKSRFILSLKPITFIVARYKVI
jgi:hypothetical protein